jgi:hypothetical protein
MQLRARAFTLTLTLLSGIVKPAHPVSRKEAAKCREQYTSGTAASVNDPTSHAWNGTELPWEATGDGDDIVKPPSSSLTSSLWDESWGVMVAIGGCFGVVLLVGLWEPVSSWSEKRTQNERLLRLNNMAPFCHTADTILSWLHQELLSVVSILLRHNAPSLHNWIPYFKDIVDISTLEIKINVLS